ncbi:MAG: hypothetical protein IJO74_06490 [Clostridia bacterium]|nr:hypothetical protein [Clostridia bacterium]
MYSSTPIIVRLLLNQFAMSIFGIMLTMSTIMVNNTAGAAASCVALFLYFYLIYQVMWEKGARNVISEKHNDKNGKFKGVIYSVAASVPTILFTLIFSVITEEMTCLSNFANITYAVSKMILMFAFQGMYHGLANLFDYHFVFYIIALLPAIILGSVAYYMGYKNIRILPEKKK